MASAQCGKPNTAVEVCQPKCQQKPNTITEVCQPKCQHSSLGQNCQPKCQHSSCGQNCQPKCQHQNCQSKCQHSSCGQNCQPKCQQSSFGQKLSELTNKAFKGHYARQANNQKPLQFSSQTQVESQSPNGSKTEALCYGQTQTHHDKKHGVSKTQVTVTVVQAQITQTTEDHYPYGTTTSCFGGHGKKNGELNNRKDTNFLRRIKNGMSRHSNNEGGCSSSSSSSDSESENEKKCPKTKTRNGQLQTGCN